MTDDKLQSQPSETDLVNHMKVSLKKAENQYALTTKLDKSYESKPPNINKVETRMLTLNFYHLKTDKGYYLIKDLYFLVNICLSQVKITLMLLRMIKRMRSNHEPGVEQLMYDVKYVLCKLLDYNVKVKDKLYEFKTEVSSKFKLRKFGLTDLSKDKLDKFSNYIKKLDGLRGEFIGVTEEQSYHTNKSIEIIDNIIKNYDVNEENKDLKADLETRKIVLYASDKYETEHMMYGGMEIQKLYKLTTSAIDELFSELDGGVEKENKKDMSAEKLDFVNKLKEEIKTTIMESSEYKELQTFINDSTSKIKLLDEGDKKAGNVKKQITKLKAQLKTKIEKIATRDLDEICKSSEYDIKAMMKELNTDVYLVIYDIADYAYRIDKLFTIFDKFPDSIPNNFDKYAHILKEKICVICLEYIRTENPLKYKKLSCGHYYHKVCYDTFFIACCHTSIYDLKKPYVNYRDEKKASDETYNFIMKQKQIDYPSVRMLVVEFNLILCGLVQILKRINWRISKICNIMAEIPKQNTEKDKLNFKFILERVYEAEINSLISPTNDLKRLVFITFEVCRLHHLELNQNYI